MTTCHLGPAFNIPKHSHALCHVVPHNPRKGVILRPLWQVGKLRGRQSEQGTCPKSQSWLMGLGFLSCFDQSESLEGSATHLYRPFLLSMVFLSLNFDLSPPWFLPPIPHLPCLHFQFAVDIASHVPSSSMNLSQDCTYFSFNFAFTVESNRIPVTDKCIGILWQWEQRQAQFDQQNSTSMSKSAL